MSEIGLREILREAVKSAVKQLEPHMTTQERVSQDRWTRLPDGRFAHQVEQAQIWRLPAPRERSELMSLPEVRALGRFAESN